MNAASASCFRYASIPVYSVPLVAPWQCNLGAALLWPLQLYWFTLICRGALRQFIAGRSNSPLSPFKDDHGGCLTSSNGCPSHQEDGHTDRRWGSRRRRRREDSQISDGVTSTFNTKDLFTADETCKGTNVSAAKGSVQWKGSRRKRGKSLRLWNSFLHVDTESRPLSQNCEDTKQPLINVIDIKWFYQRKQDHVVVFVCLNSSLGFNIYLCLQRCCKSSNVLKQLNRRKQSSPASTHYSLMCCCIEQIKVQWSDCKYSCCLGVEGTVWFCFSVQFSFRTESQKHT